MKQRPSTSEAQLGEISRSGSWTRRKSSAVEVTSSPEGWNLGQQKQTGQKAHATQSQIPEDLQLRNLGPLDKTQRGIVRRSFDQSWGNLVHWWKQLCLRWKKKSWICSSLQFWDHRGQLLPPGTSAQLADLIALTQALELGKWKRFSHLHWLHLCLSGATCACCYWERKRPLDHPRVSSQICWSNP